jgi:hypothetical protein
MRLTVVDVMERPHGGRILRLRQLAGDPMTRGSLRGHRFRARSPKGDEQTFTIEQFALFGGRVTDQRLARTGRVDVVITDSAPKTGAPGIGRGWLVTPA